MLDVKHQFQDILGDKYKIVREIGRGGMATVFLAEEAHPNREVAVKILEPDLATEIARERFLREVELASQLTHPHIVPIFAAGEANGLLYYVMPYIEGPSLRARLVQDGRLPVEDALVIASDVGDALEYAHSKGVVHRDIKPENILLSEGHAVVADFGIARALCASCEDNLTIAGVPIGTPAYMSPEQATGEEVDPRSDEYSLASVVYEMLTGEAPFRGPTIEAMLQARFVKPTPSLSRAGWKLSRTIDQAVQKALQIEPEGRFETVADFLKALRPRSSAEFAADTVAETLPTVDALQPVDKSVAVLPFSNLSPDPDNEYFSVGITEDIITQLSKVKGLDVTSRTSVMQYKDTTKSLGQIAGDLGVNNVLEGSVRRAGNRVRVVAQLVDARTDKHVWAEHYDRELTDIFEIQSQIAEQIANALEATLTPSEKEELAKKPTDNLEAYNLYLQGRFYWSKFTPAGVHKGIEFFQQAAELDEGYALAQAGLADSHMLLGGMLSQVPPKEAFPAAKEAALKAIELDDTLADAHATLGAIHMWYDWDWPAAEREFGRAAELEASSEKPLVLRALCLAIMGQQDEALRTIEEAQERCPISVQITSQVGLHYYWARRYDEAIEHFRTAIEMDSTSPPAHFLFGWTLLEVGQFEEAISEARAALELTGNIPARLGGLGCALAAAGRREEAEDILTELKERRASEYVSAADVALLAAYLGRKDESFEWLDQAVEERSPWVTFLNTEPLWDSLRGDKRLDKNLKRVGLI